MTTRAATAGRRWSSSPAVRNWEELEQALRETRFADGLSEPLPVGHWAGGNVMGGYT